MVPTSPLLRDIRQENLQVYRSSSQRLREDVGQEAQISQDYRGRLIYELIQNADDAILDDDVEGKVYFRLTRDCLWVANSGRPLDETDIRGLCGISASSKRVRGKKRASIGHKGMGFKSVLEVTDAPEVYSSLACFGFSRANSLNAVRVLIDEGVVEPTRHAPICRFPYDVASDQAAWRELCARGFRTAFRFPFRSTDKNEQRKRLETDLIHLPVSSLLFLKRLRVVEIEIVGDGSGFQTVWRVRRARQGVQEPTSVAEVIPDSGVYTISLSNGLDEEFSFVVAYDGDIPIGDNRGGLNEFAWDGVEVTETAVAARISGDRVVALPPDWRLLHVFLPSAEPCPYDVLISAAFNSNLSRQEIKVEAGGHNYNRWLITNAARLFCDHLLPALLARGCDIAHIIGLLRRSREASEAVRSASHAVHEAFRAQLAHVPLIPTEVTSPIAISSCAVPTIVRDPRFGQNVRRLCTPHRAWGSLSLPDSRFCGSDLAGILVDHGAYELSPEESARLLSEPDPDRSMLGSHPSDKVFTDPVLIALEQLWSGIAPDRRAGLENAVRRLPLFPVSESYGRITRIATQDLKCFYPPRSLKGEVGLSGLCFLLQELCWGFLSPTERNDVLAREMPVWQALFELREFKFPDVMRASVLPALDLESDPDDPRRIKLRSLEVLAAICQLAGRNPDASKPLPYERLGADRGLFNLSRLDVPCRSPDSHQVTWVPAYRTYFGEDWVGDASFQRVCHSCSDVGENPPAVNFLISPAMFSGLLDRFKHLNAITPEESAEEGADEVSLDEDEDAALDSDEQGCWLRFFRWLGVNVSLRPIHFHDVEDRASGWTTTRLLQRPSGWAFRSIPDDRWLRFVDEIRPRSEHERQNRPGTTPFFYQLHDLEHIVHILEVAARDKSAAVGRVFYEHLARNWSSLARFSQLEIAFVTGDPRRRTKPQKAYDNEVVAIDQGNFWIHRLRGGAICPTGHGPRKPEDAWMPTQEVLRRFGRRLREGMSCLLPTVDLPADLLKGRAKGLLQAIGVRDELSPASFSTSDAISVLSRIHALYADPVEQGSEVRQELREIIRPAYRNMLELLAGNGATASDEMLRSAPLLVSDGTGRMKFLPAREVFYLDRRDTRERLRSDASLWTFVLEAERAGKSSLVEKLGCRVLEDSIRWMPIVSDRSLSDADLAVWRKHLYDLAPYILARVGADRFEETQLRRDASRLRRFLLALEPVSEIQLKCTLDGRELTVDAVDREAFVDDPGLPDGGLSAFVRWGEIGWPPTDDESEALATAFGEILGSGYFESFLALIRAPNSAKREHFLRRAGAPTDIAERRSLLFETDEVDGPSFTDIELPLAPEPKSVGLHQNDDEQPAHQPAVSPLAKDGLVQIPLYTREQLVIDGVPVILSSPAQLSISPDRSSESHRNGVAAANPIASNSGVQGYGGHTDLDRLNDLGMSITFAYELARLRKAGGIAATVFDPSIRTQQLNAAIFDVSSPSRIAEARTRCPHFDCAFRELVQRHGVSGEWPGFDVLTLSLENYASPDRLIELKSSGVCARVQEMSWNEWKSARTNELRQRFYLYLVGNLRSDLVGSTPFIRAIRDPFEQLMSEVSVSRRLERRIQLAVHQFQEAEHLELTVRCSDQKAK
jgi:hypothetical protein